MREYVELIRVIAWPALVAVILTVFYGPLSEFLKDLGKRATKLSAFNIKLEIASLTEAPVVDLTRKLQELRQAQPVDSSMVTLFEQLRGDGMDYVLIDLGGGNRWLTSRLFIFAVMLMRLRGLRSLVFVSSESNAPRHFIASARPEQVRWALAQSSPWLERSLAQAYAKAIDDLVPEPARLILSASGAIDAAPAMNVVSGFLHRIQAPGQLDGWVAIGETGMAEHAAWLDSTRLELELGSVLYRSAVDAFPERTSSQIFEAILRCNDPFVALLDRNERFQGLVDRQAILEQVALRQ